MQPSFVPVAALAIHGKVNCTSSVQGWFLVSGLTALEREQGVLFPTDFVLGPTVYFA